MALLVCCIALMCGCSPSTYTQSECEGGYLLIDPGHGGFDGGSVAEDGTVEKHINLAVSLTLRDLFLVCGLPIQMTRDTDVGLVEGSEKTIRQKKSNDMHKRLDLYNQAHTVISIHQNHFSQAKYAGTQVFYSVNHSDSILLAGSIRDLVGECLQPDNTREIKAATDGIYLLHHTSVPAVLVECGFLSNPQERERLLTEEYRQQLAFVIAAGYWKYMLQK